jgi:enoyl-CoA hydratase/carnithine racemase
VLKLEAKGDVTVLRLDRPERRNAMGLEMVRQLDDSLEALAADEANGAILLTGATEGFCAGSDLKELAGLDAQKMGRHEEAAAAVCRKLLEFPKPVVVAVEGFAIGGGFILAAAADLVVSSRQARWHLPEVTLGWLPPWGLHVLVRRVGLARARLLAWGADPIDGEEAHRLGLVDVTTDAGGAEACGLQRAQRLAALPREAAKATKLFLNFFAPHGNPQALDHAATAIFEGNCQTMEARATFERFTQKMSKPT